MAKMFLIISSKYVFYYVSIILASFSVCLNNASEIKRPRGVSISKSSLYSPDRDFTCFDSSLTISFTQVNDDFCDCSDGSDEPGTSACPNSFFHCVNAGHRPLNIPSSRVNDGICDCCDGSDEYSNEIYCENNCHELGKAARIEAQKQLEVERQGNEIRLELSKKGKQLKAEKADQLVQLEKDKNEAESIKEEKEKLKNEVEESESVALEQYKKIEAVRLQAAQEADKTANEEDASKLFNLLDSNQDGRIDAGEIKVRQTFDQNKDGAVTDDEINFFLDNHSEIGWEEFMSTAYSRMKPFFMIERGLFQPPAGNEHEVENEGKVRREGVGTVEDVTHQYHQEQHVPLPVEHEDEDLENGGDEEEGDEDEEEEEETETEENDPTSKQTTPEYDPETQRLVDAAGKARAEFEEADRELRDIQREMSQIQESLEKDYGPDEEFAPLEGECFEFTDREYKYKLCPFDQASQQSIGGGSETRLGTWGRWAGPDSDKYQAMLYDRGQSCWNGPQRSAFVKLSCGLDTHITSVTEPSKCEYLFEMKTPAVCRNIDHMYDKSHDEL